MSRLAEMAKEEEGNDEDAERFYGIHGWIVDLSAQLMIGDGRRRGLRANRFCAEQTGGRSVRNSK